MMTKTDAFYLRFEDRFRGSRAIIKTRLSIYLNLLVLLPRVEQGLEILDIGCGRGEWLELLKENGWRAYGRDLNQAMVDACQALGLDVELEDALSHLRDLPDNSLIAITGFHIVEHIAFDILLEIFTETLRILKPGGLVIFETPNPENFQVGTHTFFLDPTHVRPIPPGLISFIAEDSGYKTFDILRLHPYDEMGFAYVASESTAARHCAGMAFGAQDYAIVASKAPSASCCAGDSKVISAMIDTLNQRAIALPVRMAEHVNIAEAKAQQAEAKAQQAEAKAQQAEAKAQQAEAKAQQAEARASNAEARVVALLHSLSWRITAPLRWVASPKINRQSPFTVSPAPTFIDGLIRWGMANPRLVAAVHVCLKVVLPLHRRMTKRVVRAMNPPSIEVNVSLPETKELADLTPHAHRIHAELKSALAERRQEKD